MVSRNTHISWTDSTWNPTTGCTPISAGCDHCYAKAMTDRLFGGDFGTVRLHLDRLSQAASFRPIKTPDGPRPRMVFVNSMSDLMHDDISDEYRDRVFDEIDRHPQTVFQVLTKRAITLRRYIAGRYSGRGVPDHLWLGVSVEDSRTVGRIWLLQRLKEAVGEFCAFLSVEPLIGDPIRHDYTGIDWVLVGGESGPGARDCRDEWLRTVRDRAWAAEVPLWFKQFGTWRSNPLYAAANGPRHIDKVRQAIAGGEVMAEITSQSRIIGEKGGATLDGRTFRELPLVYGRLTASLRDGLSNSRFL